MPSNMTPDGIIIVLPDENTVYSPNQQESDAKLQGEIDSVNNTLNLEATTPATANEFGVVKVPDNSSVSIDAGGQLDVKIGPGLAKDASGVISNPSATPHGKQLFTASGSFTVPDKVTEVWVSLCGGGGNGGAGTTNNNDGAPIGGGGGGAGAAKLAYHVTGLTPLAVIPVTVGTPGTISSFGAYVSCSGGGNGGAAASAYAGTPGGGGASGGAGGNAGSTGGTAVSGTGGMGGSGLFGTGGHGGFYTIYSGIPASGYGAGGGGSYGYNTGGSGSPGMVLVEW